MVVFKQIELTNLDTRSKAVGVSKPALTTETVGQVIATPQQKQTSPKMKNSKKEEQPLDYDPTSVQTHNLTNNVANFRVGR